MKKRNSTGDPDPAIRLAEQNALRRLLRCAFSEQWLDLAKLIRMPGGSGAWLPLDFDALYIVPGDAKMPCRPGSEAQSVATLSYPATAFPAADKVAEMGDFPVVLYFSDLRIWPGNIVDVRGAMLVYEAGQPRAVLDTASGWLTWWQTVDARFQGPATGFAALQTDIANSIDNDRAARAARSKDDRALLGRITASGHATLLGYLDDVCPAPEDAMAWLDHWGAIEGHPFYPTWKSKPGMDAATVAALSPEFHPSVSVRIGALRAAAAHVECEGDELEEPCGREEGNRSDGRSGDRYRRWFADRFPIVWAHWCAVRRQEGEDPVRWLPLPLHPWHLEHVVAVEARGALDDDDVRLAGPHLAARPSMSFRTVRPMADPAIAPAAESTTEPVAEPVADCGAWPVSALPTGTRRGDAGNRDATREGPGNSAPAMPYLKLPVALHITSERRTLQPESVQVGPRISALLRKLISSDATLKQTLAFLPERFGVHYRVHADGVTPQESPMSRMLSVICRDSTPISMRDASAVHAYRSVAALFTTSPIDGRALFVELVRDERPAHVVRFFERYATVVMEAVLTTYLRYGIALEAHQQNAFIGVDAAGVPVQLLIRDFSDIRWECETLARSGHSLRDYVDPVRGVRDSSRFDVRATVLHACFVCHLHEMAMGLARTFALPSAGRTLWTVWREATVQVFDSLADSVEPGRWSTERAAFLDAPWPVRSVLGLHLSHYADPSLHHDMSNPLRSGIVDRVHGV